ncbi:hypothetical protein BH09VER1_BH09VER1_31340 [soil metagenome]
MKIRIIALSLLALFSTSPGHLLGAPKYRVPIINFPPSFASYDKSYPYDQTVMIQHMERLLGEARHKVTVSDNGWGKITTLDKTVAEPLALCIITTELYGKADPEMEKIFSRLLGFLGYMLVPENILSPDRQAAPYSGFGLPRQAGELYDAPGTRQTFEQFLREASSRMNARSKGYRMNIYRGLR